MVLDKYLLIHDFDRSNSGHKKKLKQTLESLDCVHSSLKDTFDAGYIIAKFSNANHCEIARRSLPNTALCGIPCRLIVEHINRSQLKVHNEFFGEARSQPVSIWTRVFSCNTSGQRRQQFRDVLKRILDAKAVVEEEKKLGRFGEKTLRRHNSLGAQGRVYSESLPAAASADQLGDEKYMEEWSNQQLRTSQSFVGHERINAIPSHPSAQSRPAATRARTLEGGRRRKGLRQRHRSALDYLISFGVVESKLCEEACSICMENYSIGDHVVPLPCLHKFHRHCVAQWFDSSQLCPLCRQNIFQ